MNKQPENGHVTLTEPDQIVKRRSNQSLYEPPQNEVIIRETSFKHMSSGLDASSIKGSSNLKNDSNNSNAYQQSNRVKIVEYPQTSLIPAVQRHEAVRETIQGLSYSHTDKQTRNQRQTVNVGMASGSTFLTPEITIAEL